MSDDNGRLQSVSLEGDDPNVTRALQAFLRGDNDPVNIPSGKISRETLTDIAQENVGLAFNRITSIAQNGDDKIALQAAREVLDRAHGKVANDAAQVIVPIQINVEFV